MFSWHRQVVNLILKGSYRPVETHPRGKYADRPGVGGSRRGILACMATVVTPAVAGAHEADPAICSPTLDKEQK